MARYVFTPTETRHPTKRDLTFLLRHIAHDYLSSLHSMDRTLYKLQQGEKVSRRDVQRTTMKLHHVGSISKALTYLATAPHLTRSADVAYDIRSLRDYGRLSWTEHKIRTGGTIRHAYINHRWSVYLQLFNFLQNAIQATATEIVLSAEVLPLSKYQRIYLGRNGELYQPGEPFVHASVADNGRGIPGRELPGLFAPRDHSSKRGVGLSLVDYVCDTIHGYVTVESTVGEGSTFTLTFAQERKNRA